MNRSVVWRAAGMFESVFEVGFSSQSTESRLQCNLSIVDVQFVYIARFSPQGNCRLPVDSAGSHTTWMPAYLLRCMLGVGHRTGSRTLDFLARI